MQGRFITEDVDTLDFDHELAVDRQDMQDMVAEFMVAADQVVGGKPGLRDQLLRVRLMTEESAETCAAIWRGDIVETIDGLCDLLYVTLGTAVAIGIDIRPFFAEVQRSNMAKVDPITGKVIKDTFGKVVKPEGWMPPDIKGMFEKLYGPVENCIHDIQSHDSEWQKVFIFAKNIGVSSEDAIQAIGRIGTWQE